VRNVARTRASLDELLPLSLAVVVSSESHNMGLFCLRARTWMQLGVGRRRTTRTAEIWRRCFVIVVESSLFR
jgi:hypothetical protein